jgi:3-phosphoshikimate 1-carboxyvinyltransferase
VKLSQTKALFEPSVPKQLAQSLRVEGCSSRTWKLSVPGSKSVTNRALVLAGLSAQPIELCSPLLADDTWWGFCALEKLGFDFDLSQFPQRVRIAPPQAPGNGIQNISLHLGQAGTLARFLPALLLNWQTLYPNVPIDRFTLDADAQLQRRPLTPLLEALRSLGARIEFDHLPLQIQSSPLQGQTQIDGSQSGQFLSGLLLAAAGSRRQCRISRVNNLVQPDYVRITLAMLNEFGADVVHDNDLHEFSIEAKTWRPPESYSVEADASTACYFIALACVLGAELSIENLGSKTLQPDFQFLEILKSFGFPVYWKEFSCGVGAAVPRLPSAESSMLHLDMSACSDQAITAGVVALCTGQGVRVSGVAHIRHHESNRIAAFCANARALGVAVQEFEDGFLVPGGTKVEHLHGVWPTHHDHRFALAGLVLAACAPQLSVLNVECMKKTAPHALAHLMGIGFSFDQGIV